jgi:NAD(P)-dependent dehydrogenase (short-subunit alcohol dehydrogenase family)
VIVADLTDPAAAPLIADTIEREHGHLNLLVNNAGARWSTSFEEGGWENVERHMRVNFEAPVRLIEALLPLLRRTVAEAQAAQAAQVDAAGAGDRRTGGDAGGVLRAAGQRTSSSAAHVAIVNVSSTSGRVARRGTGGYAASKFAFAGWNDSLALELAGEGIHVGLVLPGFIATEGFPQAELRAKPLTRWMVADASVVVDAILETGPGGRAERYAPRYYWLFGALRLLAPRLLRRVMDRGTFTTTTRSR